MPNRRRGEIAELKKNQQVRREALEEITTETEQERPEVPRYRNPNRDQSRGDWDRSHHLNEGRTSNERNPDDDEVKP